jgi:hypothetical protein
MGRVDSWLVPVRIGEGRAHAPGIASRSIKAHRMDIVIIGLLLGGTYALMA